MYSVAFINSDIWCATEIPLVYDRKIPVWCNKYLASKKKNENFGKVAIYFST